MGDSPDKKTAPELRRRPLPGNSGSLVSFILDVFAGIFHVFTKTVSGMTAGENNLAHDCDQETEGLTFQHFHLFAFP